MPWRLHVRQAQKRPLRPLACFVAKAVVEMISALLEVRCHSAHRGPSDLRGSTSSASSRQPIGELLLGGLRDTPPVTGLLRVDHAEPLPTSRLQSRLEGHRLTAQRRVYHVAHR